MTRWLIHPEIRSTVPDVIEWMRAYLAPYNTSQLDRVRLNVRRTAADAEAWPGVDGYCDYPEWRRRSRKGFRIHCNVEGPYPYALRASGTRIRNQGEAVAWILGHEMFHFLCETGQVSGRNSETKANEAGKAAVTHYRAFLRKKRMRTS